jgi:hypothetical protein
VTACKACNEGKGGRAPLEPHPLWIKYYRSPTA